jgi:type III secretory pathway component EscT
LLSRRRSYALTLGLLLSLALSTFRPLSFDFLLPLLLLKLLHLPARVSVAAR